MKHRATTAYPFTDTIEYIIIADGPADLHLRVPSWAEAESSITTDFTLSTPLQSDRKTGLHKVVVGAGSAKTKYDIHSSIRIDTRSDDTIAVYERALLYAIEVKHTTTSTKPKAFRSPHDFFADCYAPDKVRDWEYKSASTWALAIDPLTLRFHMPSLVPRPTFTRDANVGYMSAQGCEIDWPPIEDGVPGPPPPAAVRRCVGNRLEVKFTPYGYAKLHIAEIPVIRLRQDDE
ncbi:hypothetical protein AMS68_005427 [Peltaster fructicola]|uniref:Uncharacterized protein n=1 Tax=Peltaster fructicola TaxID=286661 RepID=A0A6H0XZS2_9PEZI|nr:hypothetical protein AMS68_005427 [Peltaster fructicola]